MSRRARSPTAPGARARAAIPTERMAVITSPVAPFLGEIEEDEGPIALLYAGELVIVGRPWPDLHWRGLVAGLPAERIGPMVEVLRAPGDAGFYGFRSDLGAETDVPSTAWLCAELVALGALDPAHRSSCVESIRRLQTSDGALGAYLPHLPGPCPVALVRGGHVSAVQVDGLNDARPLVSRGRTMLAATRRWSRDDGTWSGGALQMVALGGQRATIGGEIQLDEIDARGPATIASRVGGVRFDGEMIWFSGVARTVARDSGKEMSSHPVDEGYQVGPDGRISVALRP